MLVTLLFLSPAMHVFELFLQVVQTLWVNAINLRVLTYTVVPDSINYTSLFLGNGNVP